MVCSADSTASRFTNSTRHFATVTAAAVSAVCLLAAVFCMAVWFLDATARLLLPLLLLLL
jgi:hypothetical protein